MLKNKKQGVVVKWDDARGFGFIHSATSTANVFFHVRDFRSKAGVNGGSIPQVGMSVSFDEIQVSGKGPRGVAVQPTWEQVSRAVGLQRGGAGRRSSPGAPSSLPSGVLFTVPLIASYLCGIFWTVWTGLLPAWVMAILFAVNCLTFYSYWKDKQSARLGQWRTSEAALHLWSLAGGWPSAWLAQRVLRHKSRKQPFRGVFWATVVLHCTALLVWVLRQ